MHSKFGATVMACLLYGQGLFGLVAVAAVVMKDPAPAHRAAEVAKPEVRLALAGGVVAQ